MAVLSCRIEAGSRRSSSLATLLAEASQPLRRRDYQALRCPCGVAPVTRRSGKSAIVVRRLATHPRLRDALYHWARAAVRHDPASKAKSRAGSACGPIDPRCSPPFADPGRRRHRRTRAS
ncbi:transposase [Candidatus Palauibacter sp.]|uniref:transposase n=1 Tax=Candidatus Palauibacter sp. TaxID=3101350 RepID=UPI003AF2A225